VAVKRIEVDGKKFDISYEIVNPNNEKNIIFLHGWGANKEIMKVFKEDFPEYKQVYIDLPGFGKSRNDYILTTFLKVSYMFSLIPLTSSLTKNFLNLVSPKIFKNLYTFIFIFTLKGLFKGIPALASKTNNSG